MINRVPALRAGFTLIEVIGALLIFSVGVIMLLQLTTSLSRQLEYAAINSLITVEGQERLDSLGALAYSSLTVATNEATLTIRGVAYSRTESITQCPCASGSGSPLMRMIDVSLSPVNGSGPSFSASTYMTDSW